MKKIYFLLLALGLFTGVNAQIINIPDTNFKTKLLASSPSNSIAKNLSGVSFKIDANSDGQIQVSEATQVSQLRISSSSISDLTGILSFTNLNYLYCPYNELTSINVVGLNNLTALDCNSNSITTINVNGLTNLINLSCYYNLISNLDLTGLTNLKSLYCHGNQLTSLDLQNLTNLTEIGCGENQLTSLNLLGLSYLTSVDCSINQLTSLDVSASAATMEYLQFAMNHITSIDVNIYVNLTMLDCSQNPFTSLNIDSLIHLTNLEMMDLTAEASPLNNSNISNFINLQTLLTDNTPVGNLNYNSLPNLKYLYCRNTQLTTLNLSGLDLRSLTCEKNALTVLDVSSNVNLEGVTCWQNQISSLDFSNCPKLSIIHCGTNPPLTSLFIKNGMNETLSFPGNPNLKYICADENQLSSIETKIATYGFPGCFVSSYCSFTPGGTFYTIQGNNKFDSNNNNCDALDSALPNLKFNITDGTNSGSLISDASGNYSIPVKAGTHTITPAFENPSYFTISPATVNVTFPTQSSPFTQNFCVRANGVHPDLEITLLPITTARSGFDAKYKVVYKNKGNTTQSGTVNLVFNDAVLDLVIANPLTTSQSVNNLSWDFTNLLPFETREIVLTLNVNSPMEIPAVNSGDILGYTATITSVATDDLPNDNILVFNQTVVNSLDPNDKACLEGTKIAPSEVGKYVHYMIRFENTGTFAAENVVVKDMIDTAKFDISTLVPMKGSHSFVTNITSGNKVEFIFENINLPFDDANNDGYVAFKIKTKPTLVLGNTFSNTASIYFDYNFPIVTNTATTTIATLVRQDFEFSNYFSLYPNPVSNILNISAKESITISSINIYNTLGQLVLVIPNAKDIKTVDVSSLTSGNYFIKVNSDKGTSNTKFIKN